MNSLMTIAVAWEIPPISLAKRLHDILNLAQNCGTVTLAVWIYPGTGITQDTCNDIDKEISTALECGAIGYEVNFRTHK
jgi:hypothetical protein